MTYRFGDATVDTRTGRLVRAGRFVPLEPRAFQVLCVLIERAGDLVEHDALIDSVWGGVFVTPHSLTEAISQLRRSLDDDPRRPRIIETAHRRGYRFIAPLERVAQHGGARWRVPPRLTELIGRDADVLEVVSRLEASRLVTLVGPGGVGKTQLALEVARRLEADLADGARLIDLAPASSADVERLVADAVGAPERQGVALSASIASVLRDTRGLLIFDNCERVAEPAGRLAEAVLCMARDVIVLATSQRPLAAAGEVLHRVAPLPCSVADACGTPCPAVRLFDERASAVQPDFTSSGSHAPAILEICRRLDGLPLPIELAAVQARVLSPPQILERLDARFDWPSRSGAAGPERHQTLAAMLEWSVSLLSSDEESLLEHVSVYPGGWDLDAAMGVIGRPGDSGAVLKHLTGLVDKSLVLADTRGESARYRLLDSVRLFALDRLGRSDRLDLARDRMLAHYVSVAARADRDWYTTRGHSWAARLREDRPNLRAALQWAVEDPKRAALGLQLAGDLRWFWRAAGDFIEGRSWLERLLAAAPDDPMAARTRATIALAQFAYFLADFEAVRALLGPILSRPAGGAGLDVAWAWTVKAFSDAMSGDELGCHAAAAAAVEIDDPPHPWIAASAGLAHGLSLATRHEHNAAVQIMTVAYECAVSVGDEFFESYAATNLALQRLVAGDAGGSRTLFLRALRLSRGLGNLRATAGCLEGLAYLAAQDGDSGLGARLMGAAARLRDITGAPLFPQWHRVHDEHARQIDAILGPEAAACERAAGSAMPVDELCAVLMATAE